MQVVDITDRPDIDAAFARLYAEYGSKVRAFACRRTGATLADDVVQETFLRAYRAYGRYVDEGKPWPWLRRIAEHVCIDLHRRSSVEGAALETVKRNEAGSTSSETGDETFSLLLARQQRGTVASVLAGLNPRHQRVLVLRELGGWSNDDIATQFGMTTEGVKATLKRARSAFRAAYAVEMSRQGGVGAVLGALAGVRRYLRRMVTLVNEAPPLAQAALATTVAAAVALVIVVSGDPKGAAELPAPARPAWAPPTVAPVDARLEPAPMSGASGGHAPVRSQPPPPATIEPAPPEPVDGTPGPGLGILPIPTPNHVVDDDQSCYMVLPRGGICLINVVDRSILDSLK